LVNFWYAQRAYWELVSRGKNFFAKKYINEELVSDKKVGSYCINVAVCFGGGVDLMVFRLIPNDRYGGGSKRAQEANKKRFQQIWQTE